MKTITPEALKDKLSAHGDPRLLDVRTYPEFRSVHVRGATLMPLDQLDPERVTRAFPGDEPVHVICKSGARAKQACEKLEARGLGNLVLIEGGADAAVAAGLPVERGGPSLDLMRQVQLVVGSGVVAGTLLGWLVSPWLLIVPLFFGAGLTFAGATGACGLAMVLSKMPWNRGPAPTPGNQAGGSASCCSDGSTPKSDAPA